MGPFPEPKCVDPNLMRPSNHSGEGEGDGESCTWRREVTRRNLPPGNVQTPTDPRALRAHLLPWSRCPFPAECSSLAVALVGIPGRMGRRLKARWSVEKHGWAAQVLVEHRRLRGAVSRSECHWQTPSQQLRSVRAHGGCQCMPS